MSEQILKQLLKSYDKSLSKDMIADNGIDFQNAMITRNIVFSSESMFPKWRAILLAHTRSGSIGGISDLTRSIANEIISFKEYPAGASVSDNNFTLPADSPIAWDRHLAFRAMGKCWICRIKLTNEESIERGIGPICFENVGGFNPLSPNEKKLTGWTYLGSGNILVGKETSRSGKGIQLRYNGVTDWIPMKAIVEYKGSVFIASWFHYKFRNLFSIQ